MDDNVQKLSEAIDIINRLLERLPNERHDYSGVGWCAGCGAVLYCAGSGDYSRDPCRPGCILQEAKKWLEENKGYGNFRSSTDRC